MNLQFKFEVYKKINEMKKTNEIYKKSLIFLNLNKKFKII